MRTMLAAATGVTEGILNVRKERGVTSHDVVALVRRIVGGKVGHAGTLDPEATGVLPLLLGPATRVAEYLTHWEKEYRAVLRLGTSTDTQDATGIVLTTCSLDRLSEETVRQTVRRFEGPLLQTPPMYSAVKVKGTPLYKAARSGRTVHREARAIHVRQLDFLDMKGADVSLHIRCSKGTYVRTLCADIGEALGVGGHLLELERTRAGPLDVTHSHTVAEIASMAREGRLSEILLSIDEALTGMACVQVTAAAARQARHGVPVPPTEIREISTPEAADPSGGQIVRVKDPDGRLIGLGKAPAQSDPALRLVKVLARPDVGPGV
jgi:tRNA pseudouridine55 synthase